MGLRILFVEKDVTTADLLVPSLERRGYQVTVAQTQRQATSRSRSLRPDLLVLDIASFGSNGFKVCDAIRANLEQVPAILILEKAHSGTGGPGDEVIIPPFTSRKLLYRVKKLAATLTERVISAGPLRLDPDTRTLYRGEASSHLRPKEAVLLAYFMTNSGRVLTRQEIIKEVWETDYIGDTRTLNVHVRWLRQKIEDDPNVPCFLRTVRGMGYRFEVPQTDSQLQE
jgi:DNA-binding response OmpR family regulator